VLQSRPYELASEDYEPVAVCGELEVSRGEDLVYVLHDPGAVVEVVMEGDEPAGNEEAVEEFVVTANAFVVMERIDEQKRQGLVPIELIGSTANDADEAFDAVAA